ncbi:unnamed protein product [Durusdinium trenchii]|uniref:Caltractin n=2 Tax=Durusdinium trenchii TaxID=1381693 RepID=A0ABP0J011_9DINO
MEVREFDDDPCCMVWPAARVLFKWLTSNELVPTGGGQILELGAGTGFLALCLAEHVDKVVAVEGAEQGFVNLQHNVEKSGLGNVTCVKWDWEEQTEIPSEVPDHLDMILGSDIVYPRYYNCEALCRTVVALLTRPRGKPVPVFFALCDRMACENGDVGSSLDAFFDACSACSLEVLEIDIARELFVAAEVQLNEDGSHDDPGGARGTRSSIRLFRLSLS